MLEEEERVQQVLKKMTGGARQGDSKVSSPSRTPIDRGFSASLVHKIPFSFQNLLIPTPDYPIPTVCYAARLRVAATPAGGSDTNVIAVLNGVTIATATVSSGETLGQQIIPDLTKMTPFDTLNVQVVDIGAGVTQVAGWLEATA